MSPEAIFLELAPGNTCPGTECFLGASVLGSNDSQEQRVPRNTYPGTECFLGAFVLGSNDSQEQRVPRNTCSRTA